MDKVSIGDPGHPGARILCSSNLPVLTCVLLQVAIRGQNVQVWPPLSLYYLLI